MPAHRKKDRIRPDSNLGRAIASLHATRQNLLARDTLFPDEDKQQLLDLLAGYEAEYQPNSPTQEFLVRELATADWRLRRLTRIELGLFEDFMMELRGLGLNGTTPGDTPEEQKYNDTTSALGCAFRRGCNGDPWAKFLRYETSVRRAWYKAFEHLRRVQRSPSNPPATTEPSPAAAPGTRDQAPPARATPGCASATSLKPRGESLEADTAARQGKNLLMRPGAETDFRHGLLAAPGVAPEPEPRAPARLIVARNDSRSPPPLATPDESLPVAVAGTLGQQVTDPFQPPKSAFAPDCWH